VLIGTIFGVVPQNKWASGPPIVFSRVTPDVLGRDATLTLRLSSEGLIVAPGAHDLTRISVDVTCSGILDSGLS